MRNIFTRRNFAHIAAATIMAQHMSAKPKPTGARAEYKQNFSNELLTIARGNTMLIPVTTQNPRAEAHAVADEMVDTAIDILLENIVQISAHKMGSPEHNKMVRKLLGNIDLRFYCQRGAVTPILKAMDALQIESEIVPATAVDACKNFWFDMKKKCRGAGYENCIYENVTVYRDKADFDAAMAKKIQQTRVSAQKDTAAIIKNFRKNNVWVGDLNRLCVLLTPRGGGEYHATSLIGNGHLNGQHNPKTGKMVYDAASFRADKNGTPTRVGFNNDVIEPMFKNSRTVQVSFIADIYNITVNTLITESERFNHMDRPELIDYLTQDDKELKSVQPFLSSINMNALRKLALSKYFGNEFIKTEKMEPLINPYYFDVTRARMQNTL